MGGGLGAKIFRLLRTSAGWQLTQVLRRRGFSEPRKTGPQEPVAVKLGLRSELQLAVKLGREAQSGSQRGLVKEGS